MNYDSKDELISAYLDGELTADEQASVEKRLSESAELRQLYDDLRALRISFESLPTYRLPHDLGGQVLRRAERAMLSSPTPAAQHAPAQNPATPDPVAVAESISIQADKTLASPPAPASLGGLRLPRGLRPWLWAAASIAAAVLMMTNAERPERLNEREVALNRGAKGPSDMAFTAAPSKDAAGTVADRRGEPSDRFSDLASTTDSKRMLQSSRSIDGSIDADANSPLNEKVDANPASGFKVDAKHADLATEEYAAKREGLAREADSPLIRSKTSADRSQVAQSERTIRRSRRAQPADGESVSETRELVAGNGAGGFGGGRGELRKSVVGQSALALSGAIPTRFALGYRSAQSQRLADQLLTSAVLPKGIAREDVAVVELQITPEAAHSGAFQKLLSDNHIALADGFSRHGELAGESAQGVEFDTDFLKPLAGQLGGGVTGDEVTNSEPASGESIDKESEATEKSLRAKDKAKVAGTSSGKADANKEAGQFGSPRMADKQELGKPVPSNDVAATKLHSLERRPVAGGNDAPDGDGANLAKKHRFDTSDRVGGDKPAAQGGRGAIAKKGNAPAKASDPVQLKSAEAKQADTKQYAEPVPNVGLKNQTAETAPTTEPRFANTQRRDTEAGNASELDDISGVDNGSGLENGRLYTRADGLANTWAYEAVLVEADAADVLSTMSQLEAQTQDFVQLAVRPAEVRATHDFFFQADPTVADESLPLGTLAEGQAAQDSPEGALPSVPKVAARVQIAPTQPLPADAAPDRAVPAEEAPNAAAPQRAARVVAKDTPASPLAVEDRVTLHADAETAMQKESDEPGSQRTWGRAFRLPLLPAVVAEQEKLSDELAVPGIQSRPDDVSLGVRVAKDAAESRDEKAKLSASVDGTLEDQMPPAAKSPLATKSRAGGKSPAAMAPKPDLAKTIPAPRAEAPRASQQKFNPPSVNAPAASTPAAPAVVGKAGSIPRGETRPALETPLRQQQGAVRQQQEVVRQPAEGAELNADIDKLSRWHAEPPRSVDRESDETERLLAEDVGGRPLYVLFLVRVVESENQPAAKAAASAAALEATQAEASPNPAKPVGAKPADKKPTEAKSAPVNPSP